MSYRAVRLTGTLDHSLGMRAALVEPRLPVGAPIPRLADTYLCWGILVKVEFLGFHWLFLAVVRAWSRRTAGRGPGGAPAAQRGRTTLTPTSSTACLIARGGEGRCVFRSWAPPAAGLCPGVARVGAQTYLGPQTQRSGDMMRMGVPGDGRPKGGARSVFSGRPPRRWRQCPSGSGPQASADGMSTTHAGAFQAAWGVGFGNARARSSSSRRL